MRKLLALLLLAALLPACAPQAEPPASDRYILYYAIAPEDAPGGDAVAEVASDISRGAAGETAALAERLVTALLSEPEDPGFHSPFPAGTRLRKVTVARGRATVDLTEEYASLSGVDLSVADCCLTLTLTQLAGVYAVRLTANGRELPYRETQLLTAADPLLTGREEPLRPINVALYFLDTGTGALRSQQQTLALYEGQSRVSAVLDALIRGPEGDDSLRALLPGSFTLLGASVEDGICYVNLPAFLPLSEAEQPLALESLTQSLRSLSGVEEVRYLVEGEAVYASAEAAPTEP